MWLESMIESVSDVPSIAVNALSSLRENDRSSRDMLDALNTEEETLFEELKLAQSSEDIDFDENMFLEKAKVLLAKRDELIKLLEDQGGIAQSAYDIIDERISTFDKQTKPIEHLLRLDPSDTLMKRKKKKNNKAAFGEGEVDPNEPTYCTCRMVSWGDMVGCDGKDCAIEWFHLGCVGLTAGAVPDPWYCDDCAQKLG
jgi:hypothetical protein